MEPSASDTQHNDDDFFGDQDNDQFESENRQREWEALRRPHVKAGIRDNAEPAREAHLQSGFDEGFAAGAKAASEAGFLLGACTLLEAFFTKQGCRTDSANSSQIVSDTEVLTKDLKGVQQEAATLRIELRQLAVDGSISLDNARRACDRVSPVDIPESVKTSR